MEIDYKYAHDEACELFGYLKNFLKEGSPEEQLLHEVKRAILNMAFRPFRHTTDNVVDPTKPCPCCGLNMKNIKEMSDTEITKEVATRIMEWKEFLWGRDWCWIPKTRTGWPLESDLFLPINTWQPLTDANHRDMVVERMRKKGRNYWVRITCNDEKWMVDFKFGEYVLNVNLGRAVLEAALMAAEGEG